MNKNMMLICNQTPDLEELQIILEASGIAVTRADRTQGAIQIIFKPCTASAIVSLSLSKVP